MIGHFFNYSFLTHASHPDSKMELKRHVQLRLAEMIRESIGKAHASDTPKKHSGEQFRRPKPQLEHLFVVGSQNSPLGGHIVARLCYELSQRRAAIVTEYEYT